MNDMTETAVLQVDVRAGYRVLTLNRPERMNALNHATLMALIEAMDAAEADPKCRALLLTGAGRAFCSGADLGSLEPGADLGDAIERGWNVLARKLNALRMPTVCAVNGVAAGAGANMALGCDIVLAARSAKFVQAFSKIALVPDCGGSWLLPRLVGLGRARALAMLAVPVPAEQAETWGMIWRAVDDAALMAEAEAVVEALATQPTHALVLTRHLLAAGPAETFDAQLDRERDAQRELGRAADFREGVMAFREKRAAVFDGKAA